MVYYTIRVGFGIRADCIKQPRVANTTDVRLPYANIIHGNKTIACGIYVMRLFVQGTMQLATLFSYGEKGVNLHYKEESRSAK